MSKLIMMIGLPGSGKSTIAKEIAAKENAILHSSDDMREELFEDVNHQSNNGLLFQELNKRIQGDLLKGRNVVYDATNVGYKKRKAFLEGLVVECYKECYLVATPYEKCLRQNNNRERKVPEPIVESMYKGFFVPQYYEGWDHIQIIFQNDSEYGLTQLFDELNDIPQDNSHHTLTIGEHCRKCMEYISEKQCGDTLMMAALLHDIGKKFTKRFEDAKGNPTKEAHYYGHQNVSAYLSLFYIKHLPIEKVLEITKYVQWHMQPMNISTEKAVSKSINLLGRAFYDNLLKLYEADRKAR